MKKIMLASVLLLSICLSKAEAQVSVRVRVGTPVVYRVPCRTIAVIKPAPVVLVKPAPVLVAATPVIVKPVPQHIIVVRPAPVVAVVRPVRVVYYR